MGSGASSLSSARSSKGGSPGTGGASGKGGAPTAQQNTYGYTMPAPSTPASYTTSPYGRQQPNYGYQQPNYGYQQPNYGYQQPNYGYQQPSYGYQPPMQQPSYGYQPPMQQPGMGGKGGQQARIMPYPSPYSQPAQAYRQHVQYEQPQNQIGDMRFAQPPVDASVPTDAVAQQIAMQQMQSDAAMQDQTPWYMRPPGMNERPEPSRAPSQPYQRQMGYGGKGGGDPRMMGGLASMLGRRMF